MEAEESLEETEEEKRFREIHYSSLLQQRQENETNRIKIVLISIGATIAGIVGTVKGTESLPNPLLIMIILIGGYVPWVCMLYVLFNKLKVDVKVIDDKIDRVGTELEGEDPPSTKLADKLDKRFHKSLKATLIGIIICILIYIPITAFITGGKEMAEKETTKTAVTDTKETGRKETTQKPVIHTVDDRRSAHEQSYGGRLPGFMRTNPTGSTGQDQEVTTPQATGSDSQDTGSNPQDTDSGGSNQGGNQGTETEQNK